MNYWTRYIIFLAGLVSLIGCTVLTPNPNTILQLPTMFYTTAVASMLLLLLTKTD